jgi:DNA-binding transcriptional regulator YiaG
MTAPEFRAARHALGLSAQGMADALGIADGRTIRHWESGAREVTAPVALLMRYFLKYGLPSKAL